MGDRCPVPVPIRSAFVALIALLLGAGSTAAQGVNLGTYHALVIGNQAYRQLRQLQTPVADARAVADLLKRDYGFANVRLLTNATRADMVRALDEVRKTLGEKDNLLVYYAGHGWLDREADRGYWLPVDAEPDSRTNWLSNADITDTLRALKAKHVLVVVDSCYSGTLTRGIGVQPLASPDILRLAQKKARTVLTSGGLEPVADVGGGAHSVFARAFLDALRGNAGATDLTSLFGTIRRQVLLNSPQTPEYADIRQAGHDGGDFIFVRPGARLAAVPPVASQPAPTISKEVVREYGSLSIRGRLAGIEVWLDGKKIGDTEPGTALVMNNLPVGTYRVMGRKVRHRDWEQEIRVAANQRVEMLIDIEPLREELPKPSKGEDDGAEMVVVPVGEFWMGVDGLYGPNNAKPRHRVYLGAFHIDRYEVTNRLYRRCVQAGACQEPEWNEPESKYHLSTGTDRHYRTLGAALTARDHPVVGVSWHDADAYCRWAGKRLSTEAEWEKAARGTDDRKYPWGNQWDASKTNSQESRLFRTTPVGSYPGGVSPYGVHDMVGNVAEWVADRFDANYYGRSPGRNPRGPDSGPFRIVRGGSWFGFSYTGLNTTDRRDDAPEARSARVGFRCAKSAP